jgi:hypothetical protein
MSGAKIMLLIITLMEWFALPAQLALHLQTVPVDLTESVVRFFSYFTILTNLLVAAFTTSRLLKTGSAKRFFSNPAVQTAITLYIVVVGLAYNIMLRQLWNAAGLQAVLHDLLHTAAPLLMLVYWWVWVDGRSLRFNHIFAWLIYPALYAVIIMLRGKAANWYPYPFLDIASLGVQKVMINSAGFVMLFLLFSLLFIFAGKRKPFIHTYQQQ